jgi:flavodoxin
MNIGIVYASKTGNTKKLVDLASEKLRGLSHHVTVIPIAEYDFDNEVPYDLLLIGSYCDKTNFTRPVIALFESLKVNRCLAAFVTHATHDSGPYYLAWAAPSEEFYKKHCQENAVTDKGFFHCRAKPSLSIRLFVKMVVFKHEKALWNAYKKDMDMYPGANELNRFEEFLTRAVE